MRQTWHHFISAALKGASDDPYVRLLRERLRTGSTVVRVHFEGSGREPEYRVLLALHKQLSEMRVPHSDSFTRWSLETGVRMATVEEEMSRFALLVEERFEPVEEELGRDYLDAILMEELRRLKPPKVQARLASRHSDGAAEGRAKLRALSAVEAVLILLAKDLGSALKYDESQTADILDEALERYVSARLHLGVSESLSPR